MRYVSATIVVVDKLQVLRIIAIIVAISIQNTMHMHMHMRHIVICGPSSSTTSFHITS